MLVVDDLMDATMKQMPYGSTVRRADIIDADWKKRTMSEAIKLGAPVKEGVYLTVSGPSYETRAEIHAFRVHGADVIGMSTVYEARLGGVDGHARSSAITRYEYADGYRCSASIP